MDKKISFRIATEEDIERIREIALEVWPVAYADIISGEQISYMLDKMYSPSSLLHQMREEQCEFLLLQKEEDVIGFSSCGREEGDRFKLHKLYLFSTTHGAGYGRLLLEEVCRRAEEKGGAELVLQVNKNNSARSFYERCGFTIEKELMLDIGNGFVMDDYIMKKVL